MDRPAATLTWCAALLFALAPSRALAGEQDSPAAITIVVKDFAKVPPLVLDRAQVEAGHAYRRIGVQTIWQGSPSPGPAIDDGPPAAHGFTIRLIIQPRLGAGGGTGSRSIMAAAPRPQGDREGTVYVFFDRVTDVASRHAADPGMLMGVVIAHEIGHLLLRHDAHAPEGLMRGIWDADDIKRSAAGLLWFLPSEMQKIRTTLSTLHP